jgi:hypothetical protein
MNVCEEDVMRRLLMTGLILMLAGCAAQTPPTAVPPPATATAPLPECQFRLGLGAFPQGTLATMSAVDGWSTAHWQLAVNIEGTIVVSGTSRVYDSTLTDTMRISTGRASAEHLRRLRDLIASDAFSALAPCYEGNISDGGALSLSVHTPRGPKTSDVWAGESPPALQEFWTLMEAISHEAIIPVSTCVYVTHWTGPGPREAVLKYCE